MKSSILLLALAIPCHAAISFTLPGNSEVAVWTEIKNTKYLSSSGYNTFGTNTSLFNTNPALAALSPDAGSTLGGTFKKESGGGYFASTSLYNFGVPGTFLIGDTTPIGSLDTVIFQVDINTAMGSVPFLNFNGGSQALAPSYQTSSPGLFIAGFGGPPAPTVNHAWQWDVSSLGVTSYEVSFTTIPHSAIFRLDLAAGDSFAQVIPEPSSALLGIVSLTLVSIRRRRN
jgi:hypothetical protein